MRLVLSVEKMHFLAYSFESPDTYDNVMLMCQKIKYLLICETYTEVQFHEMLHSPHFNNSPALKQRVTIL